MTKKPLEFHLRIPCQPGKILEPDQWIAFRDFRQLSWKLIKGVFRPNADDGLLTESLISLMPSMHSLCIIANEREDVTAVEEIAVLMPWVRQAARRWIGLSKYYLKPRRNPTTLF
jgi:hypothetical protein